VISHDWGKDREVFMTGLRLFIVSLWYLQFFLILISKMYIAVQSSWLSWNHYFERFTVATMTWLTVMGYLCHKWPRKIWRYQRETMESRKSTDRQPNDQKKKKPKRLTTVYQTLHKAKDWASRTSLLIAQVIVNFWFWMWFRNCSLKYFFVNHCNPIEQRISIHCIKLKIEHHEPH
jgi:hypothetical protein